MNKKRKQERGERKRKLNQRKEVKNKKGLDTEIRKANMRIGEEGGGRRGER